MSPVRLLPLARLAALALGLSAVLHWVPGRAAALPFEVEAERIAPGAYFVPGPVAVWSGVHHGHAANMGFVVGDDCVAVIDTGGSPTVGRALLAAVRRVSQRPVCYVVNTHVHPDHLLGNAAFALAGPGGAAPRFVGHAHLPAAMASHGPSYLKAVRRDFEGADAQAELVPPTLLVHDTLEIDLGHRTLALRAWPTAHTDNDLTVLDRGSGTLWLGDLVFRDHLPVLDGSLRGWRSVLRALQAQSASIAVPGHGPLLREWPGGLAPTADYLAQLEHDVRDAIRSGRTIAETVSQLGGGAAQRRAGWLLVEDFHPRNLTAAYAELEWTD
jgi:quinoprotein relay system zinc metallohydrolase 2